MSDDGYFLREEHIKYFVRSLSSLPNFYAPQECNRITLAYFAVTALDLLNSLHKIDKDKVINWVYSLQLLPTDHNNAAQYSASDDPNTTEASSMSINEFPGGFRGSSSLGSIYSSIGSVQASNLDGSHGHIALTYTALAILWTLGDNFQRLQKSGIVSLLRRLQKPNGCFLPTVQGAESDLRFVFCAAAISAMIDDWSGVNVESALRFIKTCKSYDDGYGLNPGLESHGGATFCGLASLKLINDRLSGRQMLQGQLWDDMALTDWCIQRQVDVDGGFQGRCNKPSDTCYAFWIGGSLQMLDRYEVVDKKRLRSFLLACQHPKGGFSKFRGQYPDVLHSFYGVCGLSLLEEDGVMTVCPKLGLSARVASRVQSGSSQSTSVD